MHGWSCQRCQNVYAPFVAECRKCNAPVKATPFTYPYPGGTAVPYPRLPGVTYY